MNNIDINNVDQLVDVNSYFLRRRKHNLLLSDYQINVLNSCGIKYEQYSSMKDLFYEILDYLEENDDYELEVVSKQIDEIIYYSEYKK